MARSLLRPQTGLSIGGLLVRATKMSREGSTGFRHGWIPKESLLLPVGLSVLLRGGFTLRQAVPE